ncbi:ATP-dependent DNA helicase RecG [Tepidimonas ignava]|uniref:ATP-dependent DNA helicase RecG n=1 Tax=Tepidimonas ignava TaxID=114249 RepID=A0A4R3LK48_9BURK|nr:ATP-dependent DNA helicase RecG [Tepidimonas ignava]TCS98076.1 ATP-dependent DNA helicase RecG [Tepidimonas ignava]TSE22583.1 ATP-dependent DNA helicase RecG [Tepidimonas ignava]
MPRPAAASPESPCPAGPPAARAPVSAAQRALQRLGLTDDTALVLHLPLRYEDLTRVTPLGQARDGDEALVEGVVLSCEVLARPRRQLVAVVQGDDGARVTLRFFTFYPTHRQRLALGARVRAHGELRGGWAGWSMVHPRLLAPDAPLPTGLTPVYPTTAGLPQAYLRAAIQRALARLAWDDTVPAAALAELPGVHGRAWTLPQALRVLHQPPPDVERDALQQRTHPAWRRLAAEELLAQQLAQWQARQQRAALRAPVLRAAPDGGLPARLQAALPFALTGAQRRVVAEIAADLARAHPMHRLLQGDVGSGKTVVAALAAATAIDAGWQCALMAPTEILAEQHFGKLVQWLEPLLQPSGRSVAWLTGAQPRAQRQAMLQAIAQGQAALVVGTHAVIQQQVVFQRLGLAIVDEQHRFGVEQRLALRGKAGAQAVGLEPHLLMMSATPIPRTLAMTAFGDVDVSTLDELPPGRTPVVTKLLADTRRAQVIERIRAQVAQGRQVYWVCPLVEESEALDLRAATATHAELTAALHGALDAQGRPVRVGLLHARLPTAEKKAVMAAFARGELAVLVATTVIEVGVDVPNATLMVVEHAERFGLSQLHQLRGRVGRGSLAAACVLLYSPGEAGRLGEAARERLRAMVETHDGFEIARRDLAIRGPGEFLGARQSGLPMLRFADLQRDADLIEWAQRWAPWMWAHAPTQAQRHVQRWLGAKLDYLKA